MKKSKIAFKLIVITCIFMMLFLLCDLMTSKSYAALKLTTTEQETGYVLKIGSTQYPINTIDTLLDANFALLEWRAKGNLETRKLNLTYEGSTYTSFTSVYNRIHDLLVSSATKSFADGSKLSTDVAISSNAIWKISGTVTTQTGFITCPSNKKLVIVADGNATLKYGAADTRINVGRDSATDKGNVSFQGKNTSSRLTIKGRGTTTQTDYAPILLKSGKLYFNNVDITSFTVNELGLITLPSGHDAARYLYMSNSTMSSVRSKSSGGAIYCKAYDADGENTENLKSTVYLYNNNFYENKILNATDTNNMGTTNGGSVIRSYAADNTKLRAEKCTFENNNAGSGTESKHITGSGGGAVYWKSVANSSIFENCTFTGNTTTSVGGAIYNTGKMEIVGCTFEGNSANYGGGAIAVEPPATSNDYANIDTENMSGSLTLDENTKINNNTAGIYGGGILFYTVTGKIGTTLTKYEMELTVNGTDITNNVSSSYGGGIAMYLNYKSYDYKNGLTINDGSVLSGNSATNAGGAIWIGNNESCQCISSQGITMNGGTIENNNSQVGGAIYISSTVDDIPMNFYMNDGIVRNNAVTTDGGAVYILNGNFEMSSGNVTDNQATNNGGAIFVNEGDFKITGDSIIQNGNAKYGGAVYVSGGNVNMTGGTIKHSSAISGGGIYISNGNVTMDGGDISNNQAQEYGGGIYAASDTENLMVTITSGSITGNIASKNGGGVGVNMGAGLEANVIVGLEDCKGLNESHSHPIIKDNTANENGGGFWLDGDKMTMNMYCGSIKGNLAILEPGSANIYQTGGTATVNSGEIGEGVIVIGGKYDYIPENQNNQITIIYDSNNPDEPEQKTALLTSGIEIFLPKNLFVKEEYALVGWAHTPNPTENDKIYTVGEPYTIGESDITVYAIWLVIGEGTVEVPIIKSGKEYKEITGGTNIMISSNSAFTVQMSVLDVKPNYYKNRTLVFDKNLPVGTNITMINFNNENSKVFYHYKAVSDSVKVIPLTNFVKNGKGGNYIESVDTESVDEKYIFIVELPKDNHVFGAVQMTLKRESADDKIASIEQIVTFTTAESRKFYLKDANAIIPFNDITIGNSIKIKYETESANGDETRYKGKELALIIKKSLDEPFSEEIKFFDGTNYYVQNQNGDYIIPLGINLDEDKEIEINLASNILNKVELGANLDFELWIAKNPNNPYMEEKVAELKNVEIAPLELPAVKTDLLKSIYNQDEFSGELKLGYETKKLDDYIITIELQKKVSSNSYVTQTNLLSSVDENSENTNGVFNLELNTDGNIDLEFIDGFENQTGTYRILLKASDTSGNEFELPCNFMIVE